MEEFFKLLLSKRRTRQLSSDSSLDTSPEPKNLKECDSSNSCEGEREEEGDDIILSVLNMAEGLQKPLQDILKKLEKLDAIEEAVNNLGKSFGKLEGRIHTLEDAYATTKRDVEDLKESLNANENIPEEETNKEDTEMALRTFLETELGFGDAANVEIQRVYRLGKKRGESPRPIHARFLRYKHCEKLLSLGHRLRGTNYKNVPRSSV